MSFSVSDDELPDDDESSEPDDFPPDSAQQVLVSLFAGLYLGSFVGGFVVGTRYVGRTILDLIRGRGFQNPIRPLLFGIAGGAVSGASTVAVFEIAGEVGDNDFFQDRTNVVIGIPIAAVVSILSADYLA